MIDYGTPTQAIVPGVYDSVKGTNQKNAENLCILREVLFKLTGNRDVMKPSPKEQDYESIRGQLSETIQQAHEIEDIARRIFEAL